MQKNEALITWLADHGVTLTATKEKSGIVVQSSGRLGAMGRVIKDVDAAPVTIKSNKEYMHKVLREQEEFAGGTLEDLHKALKGDINMEPFRKARETFQRSALGRKLQEKISSHAMRRRRQMSEHDGEWDYGRRWELNPFHRAYKRPEPARTIEIICDFSISCAASADGINKYGATVWAISDLIESLGIQTRVLYLNHTTGLLNSPEEDTSKIEIELKKPGEYLAPSLLAASMTSVFYRRGVFALDIMEADATGYEVSWGLGRPEPKTSSIVFEKGKLFLGASVHTGYDDKIEQELFKALEIKRKAA
jgi:hypothetical protein